MGNLRGDSRYDLVHGKEISIMRRNLAVLFLACALGVAAHTSSALAGEWLVNGTKLAGSEALSDTVLASSTTLLNILGSPPFSIECSSDTIGINGGQIVSPDIILANSIILNECVPHNLPGCTLSGHQITTFPVQGLAVLAGTLPGALNTLIALLPKTKTNFAFLPFLGGECLFKEGLPLSGSIDLLLDKGIHSATLHRSLGFTLKHQLLIASTEVHDGVPVM
jgi:hypothetical protein